LCHTMIVLCCFACDCSVAVQQQWQRVCVRCVLLRRHLEHAEPWPALHHATCNAGVVSAAEQYVQSRCCMPVGHGWLQTPCNSFVHTCAEFVQSLCFYVAVTSNTKCGKGVCAVCALSPWLQALHFICCPAAVSGRHYDPHGLPGLAGTCRCAEPSVQLAIACVTSRRCHACNGTAIER
jgi:hypothetical protein